MKILGQNHIHQQFALFDKIKNVCNEAILQPGDFMQGNFIPGFISQKLNNIKFSGQIKASAIFIDISGFTEITRKLAEHGSEGSEVLSVILNKNYNRIINSIYNNKGFVTTFIGDGFIAIFEDAVKAVYAASEIVKYFKNNTLKETKMGNIKIEIKIGIGLGNVDYQIFKNPGTINSFIFHGEAIRNAANAEVVCQPGKVMVHKEFFEEITRSGKNINNKISFIPSEEHEDYYNIVIKDFAIRFEERENVYGEEISRNQNLKFIPKEQLDSMEKGVFRSTTSIFIGFPDFNSLEENITEALESTLDFGGFFSGIEYSEKGYLLFLSFGIPVTREFIYNRTLNFVNSLSFKRNVKIGISAGVVFAGIIGNEKRCCYTSVGESVNLASRIMQSCKKGEVAVDSEFYNYFKEKHEFLKRENLVLKGFSKSVTFELVKIKNENFFSGPYIGREKELEKISSRLKLFAESGNSGVIYLYGNSGLGKSRFIFEALQIFKDKISCAFLLTNGVFRKNLNPFKYFLRSYFKVRKESEKSVQLAKFSQNYQKMLHRVALCENITRNDLANLKRIQTLLAEFIDLSEKKSLIGKLQRSEVKESLYIALKEFFLILAREKPLVIVLEDIHWLDNESKELLQIISRNLEDQKIMFLISSRLNKTERPRIEGLDTSLEVSTIELKKFTRNEVDAFIKGFFKAKATDSFLNFVYERVEGNPLFTEQLCKFLNEEQAISLEEGSVTLNKEVEKIPREINNLLTSRIDRLSRPTQALLRTAAILGREFDTGFLYKLYKKASIKIYRNLNKADQNLYSGFLHSLNEAVEHQILYQVNDRRYIFRYSLVQENLYDLQLKEYLRIIHKLAAEILLNNEKHSFNLGSLYFETAFHYEKGELWEAALDFYQKSGDYYFKCFKAKSAIEAYQKGLNLQEKQELKFSPDKADLLCKAGNACEELGNFKEAISCFEQALSIRIKIYNERNKKLLDTRYSLGHNYTLNGDYQKALEQLDFLSAIEEFLKVEDPEFLAKVWQALSETWEEKGNYQKALDYGNKSLELRKKHFGVKNYNTAEAMENLAMIHKILDHTEKSEKLYLEALRIKEKTKGKKSLEVATTLNNIGALYEFTEKYDESLRYFENSLAIYRKFYGQHHYSSAIVYNNLGVIQENQKMFTKAVSSYKKSINIFKEFLPANHPNLAVLYSNLALALCRQGKYKEALEINFKSLQIRNEKLGEKHFHTAISLNNIAYVYEGLYNYKKAQEYYFKAIPIFDESLGKEHKKTTEIYRNCGRVFFLEGKYEKSIDFLEEVLIRDKKNDDKESLIFTRTILCACYTETMQFDKAVEIIKKNQNELIIFSNEKFPGIISFCLAGIIEQERKYLNSEILFSILDRLGINKTDFSVVTLLEKALNDALNKKSDALYLLFTQKLVSIYKKNPRLMSSRSLNFLKNALELTRQHKLNDRSKELKEELSLLMELQK